MWEDIAARPLVGTCVVNRAIATSTSAWSLVVVSSKRQGVHVCQLCDTIGMVRNVRSCFAKAYLFQTTRMSVHGMQQSTCHAMSDQYVTCVFCVCLFGVPL